MQQHLLETAVYTHPLLFGESLEECRETFLQTNRHVNWLNSDRRAGVNVAVVMTLAVAALVATVIPARRAAFVGPMTALRQEEFIRVSWLRARAGNAVVGIGHGVPRSVDR